MINPNGDEFMEDDPLAASMRAEEEREIQEARGRLRQAAGKVSGAASDAWQITKEKAETARERTEFFEFFLRENPIPTVIGALVLGVAIGLAIRYASNSADKETEAELPVEGAELSILSLPLLWPLFRMMRRKYEDSADVVKGGVNRLKKVNVDQYVKPLRKKWKSWAN
jgi:hypothetical protein